MHRFLTVICFLALSLLVGRNILAPASAFCMENSPADRKPATTAPAKNSYEPPVAAQKTGNKNLRCPDKKPWSDESVAASIKVPVARLKALKAARSLTNEQICTLPEPMLKRAWSKLETGKAGYPNEWAEFRDLQRRSDDGKVKPDGLMKGFEHRKTVLKKIAEKRAAREAGKSALAGSQSMVDPAATSATFDLLASGVDAGLAGIAANQWTELGPGNIGGRIRAILIDPDNTSSIWVGGVAGGIYHSSDYGASFAPVNDFMANLAISSLVMDPANHNTLYAGTGEGFFNADGVRGYGVFKSTDRGLTWNLLTATTPSTDVNNAAFGWYYVNRLAVSGNGATLLAATKGNFTNFGGSIYRSIDGGTTWSQRYAAARVWDVKFDPNDPNKALADSQHYNTTTKVYDNAIIASTDGGLTWSAKKTFSTASPIRIELAYTKANSQIVYASVDQNSGEIWKSADGGATWVLMSTPQHLGNQGSYDNTIWVDPTNANHLVAAGLDVYRSTNGGTTFTKISNWGNNQIDIRYGSGTSHTPHADHHALVADPNYNGTSNRTLYNGNDGGLYRATDLTLAGESSGWDELNNGLGLTQFYSVAGKSSGGTRIVGGSQDNGMLYNGGPGTDWKMFQGGDGGFGAVDATNDNYLYGEYVYLQIGRSTDRGANYTYINKTGSNQLTDSGSSSGANFIAPFILDPNDSNRLLAGGLSLWQNVAARTGTDWTAIKPSVGSKISAIAVAEGNSNIVWVGHNNGDVYRTANSQSATPTWTLVSSGTSGTLQGRMVNRIVIDRDDPTKAYVAFGGYNNNNIWRTADNGATWTDLNSPARVLPSVPCFSLARHPLNAAWLYAGTEVGLFTSQDGGATWSASNDGPANVEIADLAWRDNTTLIAATHGRGMFQTTANFSASTATVLATGLTPSTYGQSVTFTATVSPASATGTVTFYDGADTLGSAALSAGTASLSTTSLGSGSHSITASYGGDSSHTASSATAITQEVKPAVLAVTAAAKSKVTGQADPPLTYTVSGLANGDTTAVMTGSLTRTAGEAAGSYAILQGTLGCSANYAIAYTGATLTIGPAIARLVISGQQDSLAATIAGALSSVAPGSSVTVHLMNGSFSENLNIATSAAIKFFGGYDADLLLPLA
ncbi:MAG: hypothetical protein FIA91_12240, partial [Geobacter sp.]|nr:hypothetical protein [Geobacter sp.]